MEAHVFKGFPVWQTAQPACACHLTYDANVVMRNYTVRRVISPESIRLARKQRGTRKQYFCK